LYLNIKFNDFVADSCFLRLNAGILANPGFVKQFATEKTSKGKDALAADIMAGRRSILLVGQFIADVSLPFLSACYGRSAAFASCWTLLAASVCAEALSRRWEHWLMVKMLAGMGLGCLQCTLPRYIAEVAPTRIRGIVLMTYNLWWTVGNFFAYLAMDRLSESHSITGWFSVHAMGANWAHGYYFSFPARVPGLGRSERTPERAKKALARLYKG
jgi:MFS family permease